MEWLFFMNNKLVNVFRRAKIITVLEQNGKQILLFTDDNKHNVMMYIKFSKMFNNFT